MALVDLSQAIYAGMPKVPVLPDVEFRPVLRIESGAPLNISALSLATHAGTHIDAPYHFVASGKTIDQIPLDQLSGPGVVVSVSRGGGEAIPASDLETADVRPGDIVLLHTGWGDKFTSAEYHDHPYLSEEAARWLVQQKAKIVGLDCMTPDMPTGLRPPGFTFPIHHILLENGVLIIENLTNLDRIAGRRVQVYAFPLGIRGSDAAQARVVAEI